MGGEGCVRLVQGSRHPAVSPSRRGRITAARRNAHRYVAKASKVADNAARVQTTVLSCAAAIAVAASLPTLPAAAIQVTPALQDPFSPVQSMDVRFSAAARARLTQEGLGVDEADIEAPSLLSTSSPITLPQLPSVEEVNGSDMGVLPATVSQVPQAPQPAAEVLSVVEPAPSNQGFVQAMVDRFEEPDVAKAAVAVAENGANSVGSFRLPDIGSAFASTMEASNSENMFGGLKLPDKLPDASDAAAATSEAANKMFESLKLPEVSGVDVPELPDALAGADSTTALIAGGVVVAGGLAFALVSSKQQLENEQQVAADLKAQIDERNKAIAAEQKMAEQLRAEMKSEQEASAKAANLLKAQADALTKEKALALDAKAAQERLNAALKSEIAATEERLQAEQAAKFLVEQEKKSLESKLGDTAGSLKAEEAKSSDLQAKLAATQEDLAKEKKAGAALGEQVVDLSGQLEREQARSNAMEARSKSLDSELKKTQDKLSTQVSENEKLVKESSEVKTALAKLRDQSLELEKKARAQQEQATADRQAAEKAYAELTAQLTGTRNEALQLSQELTQAKEGLEESHDRIAALSGQLAAAHAENERYANLLSETEDKLTATRNALNKQSEETSNLKENVAALNEQMRKLSDSLAETTTRLSQESDTSQEMKMQLAELKREYIAAGDRLESDQNIIRKLQTDMKALESQLSTATFDKKNAVMENAQLASLLDSSRREVQELRSTWEQEKAKREETEAEVAAMAVNVRKLQSQLEAAVAARAASEKELETAQAAQEAQGEELAKMRKEVDEMRAAEERARVQAFDEMKQFKLDMEAARATRTRAKRSSSTATGFASKESAKSKPTATSDSPSDGPVPVAATSATGTRRKPRAPSDGAA